MDKINRDPEYQQQLLRVILATGAGTPESINAVIRERRAYWNNIFKTLTVQPEQTSRRIFRIARNCAGYGPRV